ncbi:MAG: tetratricopeptide repeat protein [Desulfuromonadaceae bacterium]|nr:tetratricopeptide repeat protein [Desulfuromonadaceae bacterium]MDD2855380.1 tetratricopeptide repeat protein [Desulfuromonadaceae bacterium]
MNRYSPKTHILLFLLLGTLLYCYTLPYPFVFDSRFYLLNNPLLTDFDSFLKLFDIPDFADDYLELRIHRDVLVTFILRPFANFTFYLNHLFDAFDPEGYRVFNIGVHILNATLWYLFINSVMRYRDGGDKPEQQWFIPFFSALFFLVHPLATESVTYIIQRYASLGAMFYLLTILLFVKGVLHPSPILRKVAYIGSLTALFVGMMSKESLVTAPFTLLLVGIFLLRMSPHKIFIKTLPHFMFIPVIPYVVYLISSVQMPGKQSLTGMYKIVDGYSTYGYIITQPRVLLTYLRMIVAPYNQNIDPYYPLYRSIANPEIIISLLVILLFAGAGVMSLRNPQKHFKDDLTGFCIFFALLALTVSSLFPLPDLMSEHRTYLFSLPVITGLMCRIDSVRMKLSGKGTVAVITVLCLAAVMYSALTVRRNFVYSSRSALWGDAVSKNPNSWRTNYNAGCAELVEHHYEKAIVFFRRSIKINPLKVEGYANLGSSYLTLSDYYSAIEVYQEGLAVRGDEPVLYANLGDAYRKAGQLQDAVTVYEKSISLHPGRSKRYRIHKALTEVYILVGNRKKALENVRMAIGINPDDSTLYEMEKTLLKSMDEKLDK